MNSSATKMRILPIIAALKTYRLAKVAAHDKRAAVGLVIARPLADLAEAHAPVERDRADIGLVDFEEQRFGALPMQFAQHRVEQLPAEPLAAVSARDGDCQYLTFSGNQPRQH